MQLNKASFSFCCHLFIEAEQDSMQVFVGGKGKKGGIRYLI